MRHEKMFKAPGSIYYYLIVDLKNQGNCVLQKFEITNGFFLTTIYLGN
jgi:3-methyladenine DNA glycosylase Mpg